MINIKEEQYKLPSGATLTMCFRNGKLHSTDSPAIILTTPEGLSMHMHFNDGKLDSEELGTLEISEANGAGVAIQFHEGRRVDAGFPACTPRP